MLIKAIEQLKGVVVMKRRVFLICTAPTKEKLLILINEFYRSKHYIITEDNKVYNTYLNMFIDNGIIEFKNNKYYYRIIK